jgi:hypothetical protein
LGQRTLAAIATFALTLLAACADNGAATPTPSATPTSEPTPSPSSTAPPVATPEAREPTFAPDGRTGTSLVCIGGLTDLLDSTGRDLTVAAGPWAEPVETTEAPPVTGTPALDELLAAVDRYDLNTLFIGAQQAMADLPGIPCTVDTDGPGGLECNTQKGEQSGDVIPVFPQAYCEGALSRDPLPAIANFLNGAPELVSVVTPPAEPSESDLYPHGAYWVVYRLTGLDTPADVGARLHVTEDGAITVIWYGCDPTPANLATWRGEQLTEIPIR